MHATRTSAIVGTTHGGGGGSEASIKASIIVDAAPPLPPYSVRSNPCAAVERLLAEPCLHFDLYVTTYRGYACAFCLTTHIP